MSAVAGHVAAAVPSRRLDVGCLIVGGGPSGTGPLVYAGWAGRLEDFLRRGVALIEESQELCTGAIPSFDIPSNSPADRFLECLEHPGSHAAFPRACSSQIRAELDAVRTNYIHLPRAGNLLRELGMDLCDWFERSANSHLMRGCRVTSIRAMDDGRYEVAVTRAGEQDSIACIVTTTKILVATGGVSMIDREIGARIARACAEFGGAPAFMTAHQIISRAITAKALHTFFNERGRSIVIVGGSHSAFSVAGLLLGDFPDGYLAEGDIAIMHRSRIKLYYDSISHAEADGYADFDSDDICPQTKRIYRVGGLRGAARELYRRVMRSPGCTPESRVRLVASGGSATEWPIDWSRVGAVVFASGYKLREVPFFDRYGQRIALHGSFTGRYVDTRSRLLQADGTPLLNVFAVGVATGYLPQLQFGGEQSFMGRENSVWLCQHGLGQLLLDSLL